jgi:hypothetical protein
MEAARYQNEQDTAFGRGRCGAASKEKKRRRRRGGGGRIGSNRRERQVSFEEGEREARRDSRCFVTARVNPASFWCAST